MRLWRRRRVESSYQPPASSDLVVPPEPWRDHPLAGVSALLPTSLLVRIADPLTLANIRLTDARLEERRVDITGNGIQAPLGLAIDPQGRVCIYDGHHRIVIAEEEGIERLPVRFVRSEGVRMYSVPAVDILGPLLCAVSPEVKMRRAIEFALEAIEDAGQRGWSLGDAVCALELALGQPVTEDARRRMAYIDEELVHA